MSAALPSRRPVDVVVQTHWDREWYLPHQSFIARLLHVMAHVVAELESGRLKHFLFDGQTAAHEDLLANAEPELIARVRALVHAGRIQLGPWYVMADEFLVSGESLWRNLELGIADATAAGNCQRVGYLPDTFGHVGQMPQILRHFGIDCAVLWRGAAPRHAEFDWRAPDGSVVGAVHLTEGYYQHPFNIPAWREALNRYLDTIAPRSQSPRLLLTQGGDHLLSASDLGERMAEFNADSERYTLAESTLAEHAAAVLADTAGQRDVISGELRDNTRAFVLPDVLSTRRYLKRLHQTAEDRLLNEIEPLMAQLDTAGPAPARYLEQCWRLLIQLQAHDSICGCSVDSVHREMETRFAQLAQRLDALRDRLISAAGLTRLTAHGGETSVFADDRRFTLFNPLLRPRQGHQVIKLFLCGAAPIHPAVYTRDGRELPTTLLSITPTQRFRSPLDEFPDMLAGHEVELLIDCAVPGLGAIACEVREMDEAPASAASIPASPVIANANIRITLNADGTLAFDNLETGQRIDRCLFIESTLDAGDSYNYSPPAQQRRTVQDRFTLQAVRQVDGMQEMTLGVTLTLPASLDAGRTGASADTVHCDGTLRLRLFAQEHNVEATLTWHNRARDQRTRLCFALPEPVNETGADSAFNWVTRPVRLADYPAAPSRHEMPVAVNPTLSALAAGPWQLGHLGMQEFEICAADGAQHLGITLVRSIGWMSRRDLVTRGVGAGPDMATPEAQCLGEEAFQFRFGPAPNAAGAATSVAALALAASLRRPLVVLTGWSDAWHVPVDIGNAHVEVSSVRRRNAALELRLWNPTADTQRLLLDASAWQRVDALGQPLPDEVNTIAPHAIVTLRQRTPA